MKKNRLVSTPFDTALKGWLLATRPKTWIASISPVLLGGLCAQEKKPWIWALTFLFAWLIQVGTNFANDAFDFLKGADQKGRKGPERAVAEGWISPKTMLLATFFVLGLACLVAIPLAMRAPVWGFFLLVLSVLFAILYTGGPKPLGYLGLGELFAFLFFGPIPTLATYFLQEGKLSVSVGLLGMAPGAFSAALLIANNLRDEETDRKANKKTLVVRWGQFFGKLEYTAMLFLPFFAWAIDEKLSRTLLISPFAFFLAIKAFQMKKASEALPLLGGTALLFLLYTLLMSTAF